MGDPARDVASFDELYAQIQRLPEHLTGEILEPGVIRTMSRPGARHQFASRRLLRSLSDFDLMEGGRGWWFEIEREIRYWLSGLPNARLAACADTGVRGLIFSEIRSWC